MKISLPILQPIGRWRLIMYRFIGGVVVFSLAAYGLWTLCTEYRLVPRDELAAGD